MRRTASLPLPLLLTALLLAGCTDPSPMPTPPPTPSQTPVFASDEEALAAAEEAYGKYMTAADEVIHGGGKQAELVQPYLSEDLYQRDKESFEQFTRNGWSGTGETTFAMELQQFDDATVVAYVCDDFTKTDVVDGNGHSVVATDRMTRVPYEVEFAVSDQMRIVRKELWEGEGVC
jgi:hypothetical protein